MNLYWKVYLLTLCLVGLAMLKSAEARNVRVKGYTTRIGHYRQPHLRTTPNHFKFDNWSSKGNFNPYTGKKGYK